MYNELHLKDNTDWLTLYTKEGRGVLSIEDCRWHKEKTGKTQKSWPLQQENNTGSNKTGDKKDEVCFLFF